MTDQKNPNDSRNPDADLADEANEAVEESHEDRITNARHARSVWPVTMKDVHGELKVA